jgi:hypothetical protein
VAEATLCAIGGLGGCVIIGGARLGQTRLRGPAYDKFSEDKNDDLKTG